jgi:hypothetical protein
MPLNKKGKKIMSSMKERYGKKKGIEVFYASKNKGVIKGVEKRRFGGGADASKDDFGGSGNTGGDGQGRNPMAQYQQIQPGIKGPNLSKDSRQRLKDQRTRARGEITPSTRLSNQAIKYALNFAVPFGGTLYSKSIDARAMGFTPRGPKSRPDSKGDKGSGRITQQKITPIQATKPIDTNLIKPKDNFFNFVSYNVGGLSGGVSYGPPPKRGPNPQVPPVKMKKGGQR